MVGGNADNRFAFVHIFVCYQLTCPIGIIPCIAGCYVIKGSKQICFGKQKHLVLRFNPFIRIKFLAGVDGSFHHMALESRYTGAAPNDSLPSMELPATIANWSEDIKTITGGTLTANVWLDSLFVNDLIDYQVSAHYNKTDHKNIRTEWWCVVESESLTHSVTVTLNVNPPGVSVSATTSSTTTQATTPHKYYKNTKSQKDASYRSNIALQGNWKKVTMVNEASVWGGSVTKKAAITTQTSVSS